MKINSLPGRVPEADQRLKPYHLLMAIWGIIVLFGFILKLVVR